MKSMKKAGFEKSFTSPVAKNANDFNKSATHRDRKNDYRRKPKHVNRED